MKKEKGTLNDKVGSLLKSKATWWFITLVLVAVVLLYAISRNMGIWFYAKEKGLQLTPLGSERIQQLEDTIERLKNENDELLKKHKDLETKYNLLLAKKRAQNTDIRYSCYVIQREIDLNGTINTATQEYDEETVELYKHIQKVLRAIGSYNGEINGDRATTYFAVIAFQKGNDLKVDGIIGKNTCYTMFRKFEDEKQH